MKRIDPTLRTADKTGVRTAAKWLFFAALAVFFFTSSTAGNGGKAQTLLLFPAAMAVAVFESEIPAAIFGSCAGLLLDVSLDKLPGFTALWLCLCCAGMSALFGSFLRRNILNYIWTSAIVLLAFLYIDYYFYYKIWSFEGYELVLSRRLIPSAVKTFFSGLPVYCIVYIAERLSGIPRKLDLEEQNENIERI